MRIKKILSAFLAVTALCSAFVLSVSAYNGWADEYLSFCIGKGIISGDENGELMPDDDMTREQMVKMILNCAGVKIPLVGMKAYADVSVDRWSYKYITAYCDYVIEDSYRFYPEEAVTREEFLAMCIKIPFGDEEPQRQSEFAAKFSDYADISEKYFRYIVVGYEKGIINGSDGKISPKSRITRAEACAVLYRIYNYTPQKTENGTQNSSGEEESKQPVFETTTPILGKSEATMEQAIQWAKNRGAHQRFIDVAQYYWKYEELTGIRADVLYAQAAKETAYGKYGGRVLPEQNNWAGIKKYGAVGDETEDHEDFSTPEDGVRGHFNHMSAYVGVDPVGEPHGRYKSVKSLAWAGTVKTVEQLGGKWCPDVYYGSSIVNDYLQPMIDTKVK